ncbi:MAG: anthranilate synthase component I family protein, partial [Candidatus Subteraquimicrobiales bacterium]|nr:anthranilate synthase component I family protein [Candidatus Subteraquimicrobiales bacterium]
VSSNFPKEDFLKAVKKAREYIIAGDILQVVLSQRFSKRVNVESFDIYRALRTINPSPYMYYLKFNDIELVGSSPEPLVKVEKGKVITCPIAGTRPRGLTEAEDLSLQDELLENEKERAEHIMLVDLGRNDIGRVCKAGTVRVDELMQVEKYSHVMHMVSTVSGKLSEAKTPYDALQAVFPAGTVSGAPKIRAMEIIDELEPTTRGPYAGAVGYFGYTGDLDSCITIRTILVHKGVAYVQAGAGIVYDSIPEKEYEETVNKAEGMLKAVEMAEGGLI